MNSSNEFSLFLFVCFYMIYFNNHNHRHSHHAYVIKTKFSGHLSTLPLPFGRQPRALLGNLVESTLSMCNREIIAFKLSDVHSFPSCWYSPRGRHFFPLYSNIYLLFLIQVSLVCNSSKCGQYIVIFESGFFSFLT